MELSPGSEVKSSSFTFPQDIYDSFIGQLSDDRRTLKTCSYVSRSWLATSRIFLFRELSIEAQRVEELIQLVQSPLCTFPHLVRSLHLIQCERFSHNRLMVLLNFVNNLETLNLERTLWYNTHLAQDCRHAFNHIKTLILTSCSWKTVENWANFISSFPSLCHLMSEYDNIPNSSVTASITASKKHPLPNPLRTLYYANQENNTLHYIVHQAGSIESVEIFALWADRMVSSVPLIIDILARMGPSLRKLYLSFGGLDIYSQGVVFTLKHNTSLQRLDFRASRSADLPLLVKILPTIRSRVLLRILIDVTVSTQALDWPWEFISPAVFNSNVVSVEVVVRYYMGRATFLDEIRQLLGGLDRKGILQMTQVRRHNREPWKELGM